MPSARALEEHRSSGHIPYRHWCRFCIARRGLEDQHRPAAEESSIELDYFFITAGDVKRKAELEYEKSAAGDEAFQEDIRTGKLIKCFIMRCTSAKIIFGHCIPYKGAGEDQYVASLVVKNVEWLGHMRLILKAHNEPALRTLVEQSLEEIRIKVRGVAQISIEHPSRYDSQSNGGVETDVRILQGQFRTLKLFLEARIGKVIPTNHALVPWLLEYAALLLAVRCVGSGGKTDWCRARGRNFGCSGLNFAELVLYKLPAKGPMHDPDGNMGAQWAEAVPLWLQQIFEHLHRAHRRRHHYGPHDAQTTGERAMVCGSSCQLASHSMVDL